ncbi:MAG: ABC transporter ATP-binding protein [Planctomycetes bacterium]|nr:ABC transporter ATP-binding protein [Planctomycetota bacterium]
MPPLPIVKVSQLSKRFGPILALDQVELEVKPGEILGILGANGAGKTTLLHILLGLTTPTSGRVEVFGQNFENHRSQILQKTNFSSSYIALPFNLKVREVLHVFALLYGLTDSHPKIDQLLQLFEISETRDTAVGKLSSGQITRLNLCKALLNSPGLLLLDEPTASLDPDIAEKVRHLLRQAQARDGLTILYTSHNMYEVEQLCDRIIFLHRGRILASGSPDWMKQQFQQATLEQVFIRIARSGDVLAPENSGSHQQPT